MMLGEKQANQCNIFKVPEINTNCYKTLRWTRENLTMAKELILNKHKNSMEVICHSVSYTSQSIKYK